MPREVLLLDARVDSALRQMQCEAVVAAATHAPRGARSQHVALAQLVAGNMGGPQDSRPAASDQWLR